MMERLTNIGSNGEIWITDNDETRRLGRKESAYKKLADYEELEEQGLLMKLPCSLVYYIVDKGTKYATVMSKSIQDLCVFEIKGIDKDGYYWSTQEQAEQKLKEMESD